MAGMAPDLTVKLSNGQTLVAQNTFSDMLAWEQYALSRELPTTGANLTMMAFLAWRAARKQGVCGQDEDLERFSDRIVDFDAGDVDEPDPTLPGPGPG